MNKEKKTQIVLIENNEGLDDQGSPFGGVTLNVDGKQPAVLRTEALVEEGKR